jgi:hypothetical protein
MNEQDFFKLHIRQEIYFGGVKVRVECLNAYRKIAPEVYFDTDIVFHKWSEICNECSLEKPKEKNKLHFKVGMKVKRLGWNGDNFATIDYIGKSNIMLTSSISGNELCYSIDEDLVEYIPPKEKVKVDFWINVYSHKTVCGRYPSQDIARANAASSCLGQFHVVGVL